MEFTAKTVEEAIALGLSELGITEQDAEIKVIEQPTKGLFGKLKGKAVVEIVKKATGAERATKFIQELLDIIKPKHIIAVHKDVYNHLAKRNKHKFCCKDAGYTMSGVPVLYVPNFSGRNISRFFSEDQLKVWTETIENFLRDQNN